MVLSSALLQPTFAQRLRRFEREVTGLARDVSEWQLASHAQERQWGLEDLLAKASFLYSRILELDGDYQDLLVDHPDDYDAANEDSLLRLSARWLEQARLLVQHPTNTDVPAWSELQQHILHMERMLTPDSAYFTGTKLDQLAQQAVQDHRAGRTEPLETLWDETSESTN